MLGALRYVYTPIYILLALAACAIAHAGFKLSCMTPIMYCTALHLNLIKRAHFALTVPTIVYYAGLTVPYYAVLFNTILSWTILYHTIVLDYTIL